MELTIDNIKDLVIDGTYRTNIIDEFSLESLQMMKKINCVQLGNLVKYLTLNVGKIKNEQLKIGIKHGISGISRSYLKNNSFNPEEYMKNHDAINFSLDCFRICNFEPVANLITELYTRGKWASTFSSEDAEVIFDLLNFTKNTCKKLGIKSATAEELYDGYMHPDTEYAIDLGINGDVYEENDIPNDIELWAIPYYISVPQFNYKNEIFEVAHFPVNDARVLYNQKKYDELSEQTPIYGR